MKRKLNGAIAVLFFTVALLFIWGTDVSKTWPWAMAAACAGFLHVWWAAKNSPQGTPKEAFVSGRPRAAAPGGALTELVLLNEEDKQVASWNIYGKNGLVIGRDTGENQVNINLEDTTYASMIDIEHAVLNFAGNDWYVEDISARNGVSVQKHDGKKYKLSSGKPCKLERGDIIFIALTRLQIL